MKTLAETMTPAQTKALAQIHTTGTTEGLSKRTLTAIVRHGLVLHHEDGTYRTTMLGATVVDDPSAADKPRQQAPRR